MNSLDDIEKKLEEIERLAKEVYDGINKDLELQTKKYARRRAKGEMYHYLDSTCDVCSDNDVGFSTDDIRFKTGNYFKSIEDATEMVEKRKIYWELYDLAEELNNGDIMDFKNDDNEKYTIYYDVEDDELSEEETYTAKNMGAIYCLDENFLNIAKERIGEDRLKRLFK